jgi:hypothetical protein
MSKYVHGVFTSAFNTEETLDFAFLTGPKTWNAIANSVELLKNNPEYVQVNIQPPDEDSMLLSVPVLVDQEHEILRENKPVLRNPTDILSMGLTQSQYTFTIEVMRRRGEVKTILVVGDDPLTEARCLICTESL